MKKVLVCALAALFLMASCVNAFAAATYTTTTTYVTEGDTTKLKVETNVSGVGDGTMVTYLAYKEADGEGPTDDNIKFIDQQTADTTGSVKFEYTTEMGNLTGMTVKSGSDAADQTAAHEEAEADRVRTITVTCGDDSDILKLPTEVTNSAVSTNIDTKADYEVTAATFTASTDGATAVDIKDSINYDGEKITITDSSSIGINGAIVITLKAPATATVEDVAKGQYSGHSDGDAAHKMTMFAKAGSNVADKNEPEKEWTGKTVRGWGGIVVLETNDKPETPDELVGGLSAKVYPAHFRGDDGSFAVQLVDKTQQMGTKKMYACIYVVSSDGIVTYSDVQEFEPLTSDEANAGGIDGSTAQLEDITVAD